MISFGFERFENAAAVTNDHVRFCLVLVMAHIVDISVINGEGDEE